MNRIDAGTDRCQLCGKVAELRPYGPNGEFVCFPCGMKDEASVKRQFEKLLDGGLILDLRNQGGTPRVVKEIKP